MLHIRPPRKCKLCKLKQWDTTLHLEALPRFRTLTTLNAGEHVEHQKFSFIVDGFAKWYIHFGRQFDSFFKSLTIVSPVISDNHTPRYLLNRVYNLYSHKNQHINVYGNFTHNCQNLKATKMSFISEWIEKKVHLDNGILFSYNEK